MATKVIQFKVSGMMCSFCTMSIEKSLHRFPGIKHVMVNLVHGLVVVEADTSQISPPELATAIEKLGYTVSTTEQQQYATDEGLYTVIRRRGMLGLGLALADLVIDPLNLFQLSAQFRGLFSLAVAALILIWIGAPILRKTLLALRQRVINANVLLSAAAWGAFLVGALSLIDPRWPNFLPVAAWLMALHLFFGYFKLDTRKKAADAVRRLLSLQPSRAHVLRGEQVVEVLTSEVAVGETAVVRPGERIPLDGTVIEGTASVDESSFTGESVPSTKGGGSGVIGGTVNLDGFLHIRVTRVGEDTFLNQVVRLMSRIIERKPPLELLADRLMNSYGPVVFIVAGAAFIGWLLATGDATQATLVLLTTIIMGYPCALGITTPMLAAIASGKGISFGLLVKASEVLHQLSEVDTVVFDKTGTLTYGRPTVTDVMPHGGSRAELLAEAVAVEAPSEHPIGQAITFYGQREGVPTNAVEGFTTIPGQGVVGNVDGREIIAGKPGFLAERGITVPDDLAIHIEPLAQAGKTVVAVASARTVLGILALQDTPRRGTREVITTLRHRGFRTVMLTGDAHPVAQSVGTSLGVDEIHAELLPTDKVAVLETLQRKGRKVAMVGDGINDAPALAQADVGIAVGAGTDLAIESAGVILVSDRLMDVLNALTLGKASYRTLQGNVVVAVLFNIVGMGLAAMGLVTPGFAIGFMIVSIAAILLNTLRIRATRLERATGEDEAEGLAEVELVVPNMVCQGCGQQVAGALSSLPGVQAVIPKIGQQHVSIRYEPAKIQKEELVQTLSRSGFTAIEA